MSQYTNNYSTEQVVISAMKVVQSVREAKRKEIFIQQKDQESLPGGGDILKSLVCQVGSW